MHILGQREGGGKEWENGITADGMLMGQREGGGDRREGGRE